MLSPQLLHEGTFISLPVAKDNNICRFSAQLAGCVGFSQRRQCLQLEVREAAIAYQKDTELFSGYLGAI
jgi:hypothetical protein